MKVGDIIMLEEEYYDINGVIVRPHPFVVLRTGNKTYHGDNYNLMCLQLDSVKSKTKTYPDTIYINEKEGVKRQSYVSTKSIYLFDNKGIKYHRLSQLSSKKFNTIVVDVNKKNTLNQTRINHKNLSDYRKKRMEFDKENTLKKCIAIDSAFKNSSLSNNEFHELCYDNNMTMRDFLNFTGYNNNVTKYINDVKDDIELTSTIPLKDDLELNSSIEEIKDDYEMEV